MAPAMPLKVAVIIDGLGAGGAEHLIVEYSKGAAAAGLELSVASLFDREQPFAYESLESAGYTPEILNIPRLISVQSFTTIRAFLRRAAPDVVHTHLTYSDALGLAAARSLGIPAISTIHLDDWNDLPAGDRIKERIAALTRRLCASKVIAVSNSARVAYLRRFGGNPAHIVTIRNGIGFRRTSGGGSMVRKQLGLSEDDFVVGMVSVLRAGKGHDVAIRAISQFVRDESTILVIVGDGPQRPEIEAAARALGRCAHLLGYRADTPELLDAMDVLVHPSSRDALPTVLIEALAAGVPIITTLVGGIPEIVSSATAQVISAPPQANELAEAVRRLRDDPALRESMIREGRKRFEAEFTVERWLEKLKAVYLDAAGDPRGKS